MAHCAPCGSTAPSPAGTIAAEQAASISMLCCCQQRAKTQLCTEQQCCTNTPCSSFAQRLHLLEERTMLCAVVGEEQSCPGNSTMEAGAVAWAVHGKSVLYHACSALSMCCIVLTLYCPCTALSMCSIELMLHHPDTILSLCCFIISYIVPCCSAHVLHHAHTALLLCCIVPMLLCPCSALQHRHKGSRAPTSMPH